MLVASALTQSDSEWFNVSAKLLEINLNPAWVGQDFPQSSELGRWNSRSISCSSRPSRNLESGGCSSKLMVTCK